MRKEYMALMSADELEAYAKAMGFSVRAGKTAAEKISIIESKRAREAEMTVLGVPVRIPIKRLHDKRVSDLLAKKGRTDAETVEMMVLILGDDQWGLLVEAATEDDGTVDNCALGYAIARIITDRKLKNF